MTRTQLASHADVDAADAARAVDWSAFGAVIPVLAGSSGAGASVLAAALVDALQHAGRCALLIDAADPARSGLAAAAAVDGPWSRTTSGGAVVRFSWREHALLARRDNDPAHLGPLPVPALGEWLPEPAPAPLHATVIDVGQGWLHASAEPLSGAGAWLRRDRHGEPANPRPLLVIRATRPSLIAAEEALARYDRWIHLGAAVPPARLVVMAAWKRRGWPAGVIGAAGTRVEPLLRHALTVPYDRSTELGGVTDEPSPARIRTAVTPLLIDWGLLPSRRWDAPKPVAPRAERTRQ